MKPQSLLFRIRLVLVLFMIGLILSGIVIFPLKQQLDILVRLFGPGTRSVERMHLLPHRQSSCCGGARRGYRKTPPK